MLQRFKGESSLNKRCVFVVSILFLSAFGWYYMATPVIKSILNNITITNEENLTIWAVFYLSIPISSIIGSFLSNKIDRVKFLYTWTIVGVIISIVPLLLPGFSFSNVVILSFLFGASFGIGMPSCLAYFAECTIVENRGRMAGITFLIANLSVPILAITFSTFNLTTTSIIFAILRSFGLIVFLQIPKQQIPSEITKTTSFISILKNRMFLLYFVAWFVFPLIDMFERVIVDQYLKIEFPNLLNQMGIIEPIVASLAILFAGFVCDWIGRKKIILSGFVAIGAAYGIIGLVPWFEFSWYIYFIIDGIAWGIFLLMFVLILWGDISRSGSRERYYAIGSVPFFLSSVIPHLLTESFVEQIPVYAAFSLAALFLFSVLMPLVFAPETLPEKKMELRRLRSFADDARKMREKFENKK